MPVLAFCCHVDSLRWRTSHISHRSQDFTSFALVSIIRLVVVQCVSTLRIKCSVSEMSVHKYSTKYPFFLSHSSIRIYCLVTISIRIFFGKLDHNSAMHTGPIPNTSFLIPVQGIKYLCYYYIIECTVRPQLQNEAN